MSSTPFHLFCVCVACFVGIGVQFCKRASCALLCVCQSLIFAIFSLFHGSLSIWSCMGCCGLWCCYPPCATTCSAPLALLVVISSSLARTCRSPLCTLILVLSLLQILCALVVWPLFLCSYTLAPHWLLPSPHLNHWHLHVDYMPWSLRLNCYYYHRYQFACVSLPSSQALWPNTSPPPSTLCDHPHLPFMAISRWLWCFLVNVKRHQVSKVFQLD